MWAAAQAEGLSEQLDIKCAEQELSLKALQARVDAAEAELRHMAQLQRARAVRLNMQLELCRDRRAREALERANEILEDCSDDLLTAPAGARMSCFCASSTPCIMLHAPLRIAQR